MHIRPITLLPKPDKENTMDVSGLSRCDLLDFLRTINGGGRVNVRLQAANLEVAN